jgi:hypothetical protein
VRVTSVGRILCAVFSALAWLAVQSACAQLPSFSGAEGFGGTFSGSGWFSNATVYHVTNLNDSGVGSLRAAFVENSANKIIVFDVAGTIQLTSGTLDIKNLSNYYIAGQTAPGPVTIYGNTSQVTHSNDKNNTNVILRYLSFRKGTGSGEDAITFAGGDGPSHTGRGSNLILDHVSASWAEDEIISVANNNTNVTVQYSMINDALVSNHAYGSLIRPKIDSNVTFHHNLYANNASRQARFGTYNAETLTSDFRNNVVYNYRDRASYAGGSSEAEQEFADINYVGNYIIAGPGTQSNFSTAFLVDKNVTARIHQYGNAIDGNGPAVPDGQTPDGTGMYNGGLTGWGMFALGSVTDQTLQHMDTTQFPTAPVTTQTAADAYNQVLNYVGNSWWSRDVIDTRVINNVRNYTGPALAAAAPIASELSAVTGAALTTRPAGWDTDADGIPDRWETAHGLNSNLNTDFKTDFDSDGYINLQDYLDEVGAFPAPTPLTYVGSTSGPTARYALITNWKTNDLVETVPLPDPPIIHAGSNWQPSRFDQVQINSGTVAVDAAGQHADVLKIAANSGNNATLNITSGWLKVEHDTVVGGPGATAALNLTGGTLRTQTLSKDVGASFSFTGGKLSADTVNFSLINNGGTLAPGDSIGATQTNSAPTNIGQTHVVGSLTLASGTLQIELASLTSFDRLIVDGTASLGGSLAVSTLGGFTPTNGNSWQIITAGGITSTFSSVTPGYSIQQQGNNLVLFFGNPLLAGDYNGDGLVNGGDYVAWRRAMGNAGTLQNETASPGVVDQADYDAWRANYGANGGSGSGALEGESGVPEPSTCVVAMAVAGTVLGMRRSRRASETHLRVFGSFLQE